MGWARRSSKTIASVGSPTRTYDFDDYSRGMNDYTSDDKLPNKSGGANFWRKALNARIPRLGEYETRKGVDFHSAPVGETQDQAITSTTGADDAEFTTVTRLAQQFTATSAGRLSRVDVNVKNPNSATGVIIVEIWSNDSGEPGQMLARSSVTPADISSSYAYVPVRFVEAPLITATTYWIVTYIQATGDSPYNWSSTTSASTALSSTDSGQTWSSESFALNFKQYYATNGGVLGQIRSVKSDGTKLTIFAHGTAIYSVDENTGALTTLKSGLSASATDYEFALVNDIIYYVNGFDGLRKLSGAGFSTEAQVNSTNYTHVLIHKGLLMLVEKSDRTKLVYSNFADYETFTSTDFIHVPAPKTGDPITALKSLNGYLLIWTLGNKFILSGDDNATFALDEAPDQKGTYSQNTVTADDNFVYYLSDDGVYRSNGSEPHLQSENIYQTIHSLNNREKATINVNKGRLYLWHPSAGSATNDRYYVWNQNYSSSTDTVESLDTHTPIARALTATSDSDQMLVGSSIMGQVYWQEMDSNDYSNLGGDIDFSLETHYNPYEHPGVLKEIRYWNPRFQAQSGNYVINCEYAYDKRDNWTLREAINVQGEGYLWGDSGTIWGSFTWGSTAEMQAHLYVPGEYRRIALRYRLHAARQPNCFLGHTQIVQFRRLR